jgi:hypothetical protein
VSKVLAKLLSSQADATLALLTKERIAVLFKQIKNGSVLTAVLAMILACTKEFETEVAGEQNNCRLQRLLDLERTVWLAENRIPLLVCKQIGGENVDGRRNALEVLAKMLLYVRKEDAVVQQLTSDEAFETLHRHDAEVFHFLLLFFSSSLFLSFSFFF